MRCKCHTYHNYSKQSCIICLYTKTVTYGIASWRLISICLQLGSNNFKASATICCFSYLMFLQQLSIIHSWRELVLLTSSEKPVIFIGDDWAVPQFLEFSVLHMYICISAYWSTVTEHLNSHKIRLYWTQSWN